MEAGIKVCEEIGQLAVTSLLYEVSASPKPGLVDRFNRGAHKDMDFYSFMSSSAALSYYFFHCARLGLEFRGEDPRELFGNLRPLGLEAEKTMFQATGGVNTHKGLVFSMGILCAASACCQREKGGQRPGTEELCNKISRMTEGLCSRELAFIQKEEGLTHGERIYREHGFKGIRGEVEDGFPTVRAHSLPLLKKLKSGGEHSLNDVLVQVLLQLLAVNDDTNVVARKGIQALKYVKACSAGALDAGGMFTPAGIKRIHEMDREFIRRNISPGGSADLLAVTVMLDLL